MAVQVSSTTARYSVEVVPFTAATPFDLLWRKTSARVEYQTLDSSGFRREAG